VHTANGVLPASRVVVAAGIWSADLLKPLGITLPLIAERGYHLEVVDPGVSLNHSVNDMSGKFIVSSMAGGMRAAGTAEFADKNAPPRYRRADMLAAQMRTLMPGINLAGEQRRWMGIRPSFPDNLPAVGPIASHTGLYAAFGHSHWGMSMAPGTGRLIAQAIGDSMAGKTLGNDMAAYSPDRFQRA
jgi:D-amino-acid dehydrogenase